jgi:spermidine synthase
VDASNTGDMDTQLGSAYIPRFLNPDARKVLIIGYGSGTTAGASLLFPDTEVKCCELEPAVYAASRFFADINHTPEKSPRFTAIFDDGRNYLQGSQDKFDLIISEPSNPWIAGLANLFTQEYYRLARARLNPDGILVQWIQLYQFSTAEYALVARTVMSVFPECALVRTNEGDTLLLASEKPLTVSEQTLRKAQAAVDSIPEVKADLRKYFGGMTDVRSLLLSRFLLNKEGLQKLVARDGRSTINTDLNLRLEFDAPHHLFTPSGSNDIQTALLQAADLEWFPATFQRWNCSKEHINALRQVVPLFRQYKQEEGAARLIDFGLQIDPDHPFLLAEKLLLDPATEESQAQARWSRLAALSPFEASRVGVALWKAAKYQQAATGFELIAARTNQSAMTWANLGINYQKLKQPDKAEKAFRKALELDPVNTFVVESYEQFQKEFARKD